jgi:hypothetical protein
VILATHELAGVNKVRHGCLERPREHGNEDLLHDIAGGADRTEEDRGMTRTTFPA